MRIGLTVNTPVTGAEADEKSRGIIGVCSAENGQGKQKAFGISPKAFVYQT